MSAALEMMLESIAVEVKALKLRVVALEGRDGAPHVASGTVASDADIDGLYGDPIIKYGLKEKYWPEQPDPNIGYKFSDCTPEYLDATAKYLTACEYMALNPRDGKPVDEKKAGYKAKDAARARGWAVRIRARGPVTTYDDTSNAEIPF